MAGNFIDANGITIQTRDEIVAEITAGMQTIYGADINVESNSPDGQMIGLLTQIKLDVLQLAVQVYNSMDPDNALGVVLDQRVSINNIQRGGATYTLQDIAITVDRALTLQGLDAAANDPDGTGYTVADSSGNQFILLDTQSPVAAGTYTYTFRAKNLGAIETLPNTITNPVTVVLGVTGINNSTGAENVGQNGELDPNLRVRRQQSTANGSSGYLNGLLGIVRNLEGVTDAEVYENVTASADGDGIPAHGIWLIVEGGANTDIGNAIYARKSDGANMKGAVEVEIMTPSEGTFIAKFDRPSSEALYIQFNIQPVRSGVVFDLDALKQYLVDNLVFGIGEYASAESIAEIAKAGILFLNGPNTGVVSNLQISIDDMAWVYFLDTSTKDKKWSVDVARIEITVL